MSRSIVRLTACLALLGFGLVLSLPADVSAACYGTRFDYYETSACINIVGTKVSCPGYPDQYDTAADGSYTTTPWYTTQAVSCPCPPSGGTNGGEDTEAGGN